MRNEEDLLIKLVRARKPGLALPQANVVALVWRGFYRQGFHQLGEVAKLALGSLASGEEPVAVATNFLLTLARSNKAGQARQLLAAFPELHVQVREAASVKDTEGFREMLRYLCALEATTR
ncbi:MAG TPA: hypothetical protein VLA88_02095 [Candidatus Saccharimonadales bacterium]|nr:hypothetical protein [Candidatus Saccharimonadales bacterium]